MAQIIQFGIYFIALFGFMLAVDYIWLKFIIGDFFLQELSSLARIKNNQFDVQILPAIGAYILMTLSVLLFIKPHYHTYLNVLLYGAVLGFILYGVFDLTNLALLKGYSWRFVVVDMMWGATLIALSSAFTLFLSQRMGG